MSGKLVVRLGALVVSAVLVSVATGCGGDDGPTQKTATTGEDKQFKSATPNVGEVSDPTNPPDVSQGKEPPVVSNGNAGGGGSIHHQ